MARPTFTVPRGMRDIEPPEMAKRLWVQEKILQTLRVYGFQLMEPSPIENLETLEAKCGPAIREEIYWFEDKAGRKQGLRFDLTVGLSRIVASRPDLPLPAKLCALSNMWRYDEPQQGRYRCFYQWDAEIFGSPFVEADAEIVSLSLDVLRALNLRSVQARISSRRLVEGFLNSLGIEAPKTVENLLRAIDKKAKLSPEAFRGEVEAAAPSPALAERILEFISLGGEADQVLPRLSQLLADDPKARRGLGELEELFQILDTTGKKSMCIIDLGIVRGIGYYDGIVFEVYDTANPGLGALVGGGRFDELCKTYGRDIPATGAAGGIERIIDALERSNLMPVISQAPQVFIAAVNETVMGKALEVTERLRSLGVSADLDLKRRPLGRQLEHADALGARWVVIVGPQEVARGTVRLRDMWERQESELSLDAAAVKIAENRKAFQEARNFQKN